MFGGEVDVVVEGEGEGAVIDEVEVKFVFATGGDGFPLLALETEGGERGGLIGKVFEHTLEESVGWGLMDFDARAGTIEQAGASDVVGTNGEGFSDELLAFHGVRDLLFCPPRGDDGLFDFPGAGVEGGGSVGGDEEHGEDQAFHGYLERRRAGWKMIIGGNNLSFKSALWMMLGCVAAFGEDESCLAPLFSCETARGKQIRICSVEEEAGRRWSQLQYRYGAIEKPELVYPADSSKGAALLFFSHTSKNGIYELGVRFVNGGYTYRVFSVANDKGEGAAGVTVSDGKGKLLTTISCNKRPLVFPSYLQRALACDLANPHGKAACQDQPYRGAAEGLTPPDSGRRAIRRATAP